MKRFDKIRKINKWEDPKSLEHVAFELNAFNMVERMLNGTFDWIELKRATLIPDELLDRCLNRLAEEGKINTAEREVA